MSDLKITMTVDELNQLDEKTGDSMTYKQVIYRIRLKDRGGNKNVWNFYYGKDLDPKLPRQYKVFDATKFSECYPIDSDKGKHRIGFRDKAGNTKTLSFHCAKARDSVLSKIKSEGM